MSLRRAVCTDSSRRLLDIVKREAHTRTDVSTSTGAARRELPCAFSRGERALIYRSVACETAAAVGRSVGRFVRSFNSHIFGKTHDITPLSSLSLCTPLPFLSFAVCLFEILSTGFDDAWIVKTNSSTR